MAATSILMIRPSTFGFNPETKATNSGQNEILDLSEKEIHRMALQEFDDFVEQLREYEIDVTIFDDNTEPAKPDAIFPNNWVSFGSDGKIILYPMLAENRRLEKRLDIIEKLKNNFQVNEIVDMSHYSMNNKFLEGTGSMVIDHRNRIVYAGISPRTDVALLRLFSEENNYKTVSFHSYNDQREPVYHTNVMMTIGDKFAVICAESIIDDSERQSVMTSLQSTGHKVIEITLDQMNEFAGNMLQLNNASGEKYLVMSERAFQSLTDEQKTILDHHTKFIIVPLPTIERIGAGSARCMMAEIFLPKKNT